MNSKQVKIETSTIPKFSIKWRGNIFKDCVENFIGKAMSDDAILLSPICTKSAELCRIHDQTWGGLRTPNNSLYLDLLSCSLGTWKPRLYSRLFKHDVQALLVPIQV